MRFQRYEPSQPGRPRPQQPYMAPHVEDRDLPAA